MSDRPSGKQSKSRLLRPINDLFSKSFSRSLSPSVTPDNAIASTSESALPANSALSASQVNPHFHHEAQSVTANNAIASITVSSANSTTSTHQVNPQSPQGTQPITPDTVTASTSTSLMKSVTPVPQVNPQGTEYMAILELSPTPSGPLTWEHRMKARGSNAYEGLKTTIQGVYDCSSIFPPLQTAAGVLLTICKVVDKVSDNKTDLEQLQVKLQSMLSIISKYRENDGLPALAYRLENFCLAINLQTEEVKKLCDNSLWTRAFEGTKDADKVLKVFRNISILCDAFQIDTQLHTEVRVEEIFKRLESLSVDKLNHEMEPQSLIESRNLLIADGQFNQIRGHYTNIILNVNQAISDNKLTIQGIPSQAGPVPSNETDHASAAPSRGSAQPNHERTSPRTEVNQTIPTQKSNDIYERHLILKGRGFPLWIPGPKRSLHLDYRRTGVRIGDVGIITPDGGFSFLFNICLPHDHPVNPRILPEHFAPISPPIEATDIDDFEVFTNDSHLASASSSLSTAISGTGSVFESSASEGAILIMPRGARSENLGDYARFREYAAANVTEWYKFVNGRRGREVKNGDVRLVVGSDKTTSWGIATFVNQTQQNSCRLKFCPSEGNSASTYRWSENSGATDVRAGPNSDLSRELRIDSDPPDVQIENQCLFVRTLNIMLTDDDWVDIHSTLGSVHVDPRHVRDHSASNYPQSSSTTGGGSNLSPSSGVQYGTQRATTSNYGLENVNLTSDNNSRMLISGPPGRLTAHPSKFLNNMLLAKVPTAKMAITHDDDWSSVITQYDSTLADPCYNLSDIAENVLVSRKICEENGVVFLQQNVVPNNEIVLPPYETRRAASESLPTIGSPNCSVTLNSLAVLTRYDQSGIVLEDLEKAINYNREALSFSPLDHPYRSSSLNNLASAIFVRYKQLDRMEDLEEVIAICRQALRLCPTGHPHRSMPLNNLTIAVHARYDRLGQMEDLEEAIMYGRAALSLHPIGHPDRSMSLNILASAVLAFYDQSGRMKDLEEGIIYVREVLSLCPVGHQDRSMSLNNLASAVLARYDQSGSIEDLEEAIIYNREALSLCPFDHPVRSMFLNNLASAVLARYKQLGRMDDLEEGIIYSREALILHPIGHPNRSMALNNLASAVLARYDQSAKIEDLDEGISVIREALSLRPLGHPDRSMSLNNLASAVLARYRQFGSMKDLEEGIMYNRQALNLRPIGHPDRSMSLNNLASAVLARYRQFGVMNDLEEGISVIREALSLRPIGHHSMSLNNLASAVLSCYDQSGKMEDLEDAIMHGCVAFSLHPRHVTILI